jgi:hypothetical protein
VPCAAIPLARSFIEGEKALSPYKLSYDTGIANELRKRFTSEIATLENEGFSPFSLHQEITYPFGLLIFFPTYLAMRLGNEILQIQSPFRITSFHLMYTSPSHATYAYIYGLGCKFYTNFTDGTWLVSNTHQKIKNKMVLILKSDLEPALTHQIWKRHQEKISELESNGKVLNHHISFDTWVKLEQQFDQGSLLEVISTGIIWLMFVAWVLFWLVRNILTFVGAV